MLYKVKDTLTWLTIAPESHILVCFALYIHCFWVNGQFRHLHWMTQIWTWKVTRSKVPHIRYSSTPLPRVTNFYAFQCTATRFTPSNRPFGNKMYWMTLKWLPTLRRQKYPVFLLLVPQSSKFHSVSLATREFSPLAVMLNFNVS